MDVDSHVRQQEQPELPSQAMQEKFDFWDNAYTLDDLSDMTSSKLQSRRQKFESEVQILLAQHRPGRMVATRPSLSHLYGKPPYNAQEWERARDMIRGEAESVRLRFERAESLVIKEQKEAKRAWIAKWIDSIPKPNIQFNF